MTIDHQPPSDEELERLLQSRLRRTTPEFELRWRELRRTFVAPPRARAWWSRRSLLWPGLAAAAAAVLLLAVNVRHRAIEPSARAEFEQLLALDAALAPASPLLEPETRDAVLHLPVSR